MAGLASVLSDQGKFPEARRLYKDMLKVRKRQLGLRGETLHILGCVLNEMGMKNSAISTFREALKLKMPTLAPEHGSTLDAWYDLGVALLSQKDFGQAEEPFQDILTYTQKARGNGHHLTLVALDALADVLYHRNMFVKAGSIYRQIIYVRTENLGEEHPEILDSKNELARMISPQKRYPEAETTCQEIL